ncbi:MAG: cytochrome b [Aliidongia sp.]
MVLPAYASERYDTVQIALHWLTALLVVAAICLIWIDGYLPRGDLKTTLFFLHRSCGVTVLALTVLRLAWRLGHQAPPPPASLPLWQQSAARISHWLLYAILLVMPVTGFVSSAAQGHAVSVFFLFDLPLLPEDKPLAKLAGSIHVTLQWLVYALIVLHAVAALRHHFVLRDNVLRRMLRSRRISA